MIRNLKVLGLAVAAVLALTALAASAASAAEFHGEEGNLTLSGTQTTINVFRTDAGEVTCKKASFSGTTTAATVTSVTVTPSYSECHAIFFGLTVNVTVDVNGCAYIIGANGHVTLECPENKHIEVTAPGCTTTIKAANNQTMESVSFTNEGTTTGRSIIVDSNITNIAYEEDTVGTNTCASPGKATTGGIYTGSVTVSAKNGGGTAKGIWWE